MAEFQEVMKQVKRMCKEFGNDCAGCGLASSHCPLGPIPENWDGVDLANVERIVMDWVAKNPEPRYPTWNAWLVSMGLADVYGGANTYRLEINPGGFEPIPADIAEKLGIKPIGGEE